ncbi:hypothetical protein OV208_21440 [Corallococcus sp. bb12-1]|uniref:hypothetical protein n=1 Tax=Corallococcus sp. bb12-1 TaxID=2996784 RepID=UPI00226F2F08|nr:hypothetical protein [Corallococcus sp. bb12-1]MCY1043895.1 hypothetical protein [Corallococcus sp. bb12-1]
MKERDIPEAEPALRARLEEFGARNWSELAGVRLAWAHGRTWLALGAWFVLSPCSIEELSEALRGSHADLDSEAGFEEVMELVRSATGARVIRTADDLDDLTEDKPGPEVIRSGTIGARGLALWEAPRRDSQGLVFFANLWRVGGADFVRLKVDFATRSLSVEVIDCGWFEVAAFLG